MPRPRNPRIIRAKPASTLYKPQGVPARELKWETLPWEGLEAIRLVDAQGMSQAQAAESMGVSTPTLCRVLAEARNSIARALSGGRAINIEGGNYKFIEPSPEGPFERGHGAAEIAAAEKAGAGLAEGMETEDEYAERKRQRQRRQLRPGPGSGTRSGARPGARSRRPGPRQRMRP